jgi:photosystem II stability/assembly factor-like uncharacterized protein
MIGLIRVALKLGAVALMATAGVARVAEHPKSTSRSANSKSVSSTSPYLDNWLVSIALNDHRNAFVVSRNGGIMKTVDGGARWLDIEPDYKGTDRWFRDVASTDPNTAWVVGSQGLILKTSDGGQTWDDQTVATFPDLSSVSFFNKENGYAVGIDGTIVHTTNGGRSSRHDCENHRLRKDLVQGLPRSSNQSSRSGDVRLSNRLGCGWSRGYPEIV